MTASARIEEFFDFSLGKILEAAARSDAGIHEIGNDDAGFQENPLDPSTLLLVSSVLDAGVGPVWGYGSISIGTLSEVIIQISTISALVTAMQPSVQSCVA